MQQDNNSRKTRKARTGIVISNKMDKTVVVKVQRVLRDPLYGKVVQRWKKYYAHDENNQCNIGDEVTIVEMRPMSKTKRWRVTAVA